MKEYPSKRLVVGKIRVLHNALPKLPGKPALPTQCEECGRGMVFDPKNVLRTGNKLKAVCKQCARSWKLSN